MWIVINNMIRKIQQMADFVLFIVVLCLRVISTTISLTVILSALFILQEP